MKRTDKYNFGYFESGDVTSPTIEMQRFETLDAQLSSLFSILGNGVLSGWDLVASSGLIVAIAPGSGHVAFVAVESTENSFVNLTPGTTLSPTPNYIYAQLTVSSYWDKSVQFFSSLYELTDNTEYLYLGKVLTNENEIITENGIDISGRTELGFVSLINTLVSQHRHIGGTDNPSPINLSTDVQGTLNENSLPDIDASKLTGVIDVDRIPILDHITKLTNKGSLTHSQLDSFVETLSLTGSQYMGEVSTSNLLQLLLALKHIYPEIDEYLVNTIAFIPGISPDDYIDTANTTAVVDTRTYAEGGEHKITGTASTGFNAYTRIWDTEDDFDGATSSRVYVNNDTVSLATKVNTQTIDNFSSASGWSITTDDKSSVSSTITLDTTDYVIPPSSGKIALGKQEIEVQLLFKKDFNAQDWSSYNYLSFYIKTEEVEHGDIIFYLNDSEAGDQNSYQIILDRNSPTINVDTLQNGWQEVIIDITSYTRANINTIGFYLSTQSGWNTSNPFDFNIDDISLSSGNIYEDDGYIRFIYGGNTYYNFWRVRWDAFIPSDSEATGVSLLCRTRVANTVAGLSTAVWSAYTSVSGTTIPLPSGTMYKYIEIEMYFTASTTLTRSAMLRTVYLDFYIADTSSSFEFNSKEDWDEGKLFNIDTQTTTGSMKISGVDEIDNIYYGTENKVFQLDSSLNDLYKITGAMLPRSTNQAINNLSPSLGTVVAVSRGDKGNVWLSDVDNDRIIEVDKGGGLINGFYGSFLTEPIDPYGEEESGPGSNIISGGSTTTTTTTSSNIASTETVNVLHSIYNPAQGILYVVFDKNIENIYDSSTSLNRRKFYLKVGSYKIYLDDSTIELMGVDETNYVRWSALTTSTSSVAQFINQFTFTSHVLKFSLSGADRTFLDYMIDQEAPSIIVASPYQQQRLTSSTVTVNFLLHNFVLGTGLGGNAIQVTLDGTNIQNIYTTSITYSGLSLGNHTIKAQLLNSTGSLCTNIESIAEGSFIVYTATYTLPYISFNSPRINQIYSSSPVVIDFNIENFAVVPTGQHLRYIVDTDAPVDYYSTAPISIDDISNGKHSFTLYTVDSKGSAISYSYGSATVNFIVGLNSNAVVKLYVDRGAVYDQTKLIPAATSRTYVETGNIVFSNIYAPIDVQIIPAETSKINDASPTILVAKMRSPSWTNGLAGQENLEKMNADIIQLANAASNVSSSSITEVASLIYGTNYLDGHSVVQMNMDGEVILSNNAAIFAESKEVVKDILGSAEKIGDNELLIADAVNKRAIVVNVNLDTKIPEIVWQYDSDRYISDFHIVPQDDVTVTISDDAIDYPSLFVRQGTTVIWINNSASPISIYSGTTTYDLFYQDPDLNLYGDNFYSDVLQPGERYTFKFVTVGEFNWFTYPDILTGKVSVTSGRLSSRDQYLILEGDGFESPFTSRTIKVDSWGNILWSFGEGFLVKPRDARPLLNGKVIIST